MAAFAVSQTGHLTLVFEDADDLVRTGEEVCASFCRLIEKYDRGEPGAVVAVLGIPVLKEAEGG